MPTVKERARAAPRYPRNYVKCLGSPRRLSSQIEQRPIHPDMGWYRVTVSYNKRTSWGIVAKREHVWETVVVEFDSDPASDDFQPFKKALYPLLCRWNSGPGFDPQIGIQDLRGPYPTRALADAGGAPPAITPPPPRPDLEEVSVSFQQLEVLAKDLRALDTVTGWVGAATPSMQATKFPAVLVKVEERRAPDGEIFGQAHVVLPDSDYDWSILFPYHLRFKVDRAVEPASGPSDAWRASVIRDRHRTYYPNATHPAS